MPITTLSLNDYQIVWEPETSNYVQDDQPALQWAITRQDNGNVTVPTAATIVVTNPDGSISTIDDLYVSSATPTPYLVIGGIGNLTQTGQYTVELTGLTFPDSQVQVRNARQTLSVNLPYDPTTPLGQVRQYALDTDMAHAFFNDDELNSYLLQFGNLPIYAAAMALETLATDQARLAMAVKIGPFSSNSSIATHNAIAQRAQVLRDRSPIYAGVTQLMDVFIPNPALGMVFTTGNPAEGTCGSQDLW